MIKFYYYGFIAVTVLLALYFSGKMVYVLSHKDDCQARMAKWGYPEKPHNEFYMGWKCKVDGSLSPFDWEPRCMCQRWFYLKRPNQRAIRDAAARGETP